MRRREDNRSITTKILHGVAKALIVIALGTGLTALLGDVGIPVRALGMLGALAMGGTAVVVNDYAAAAECRSHEEERREIELEDRRVDGFVAEHESVRGSSELAGDQSAGVEARFVRQLEARRSQPSWKRGLG